MESKEREESRSWPMVGLKQFLILFSLEKDLSHSQLVTNNERYILNAMCKFGKLITSPFCICLFSISFTDCLSGTCLRIIKIPQ